MHHNNIDASQKRYFLQNCSAKVILRAKKASLVAQMVKNLPAMQETQVWCLDQEEPLEKGMATQSGILAWRIPWTEGPAELQSMGSRVAKSWTRVSNYHFHSKCTEYCTQSPKNSAMCYFIKKLWFEKASYSLLKVIILEGKGIIPWKCENWEGDITVNFWKDGERMEEDWQIKQSRGGLQV